MLALAQLPLLLVALAALADAQTLPGRNIFTSDCQGGVHLLTGLSFEMNFDLRLVRDVLDEYAATALDKARCTCPGAPDEELMRRFVPSIQNFLASDLAVLEEVSPGRYAPRASSMENSCPGTNQVQDPVFSVFNAIRGALDNGPEVSGPVLPTSCSIESLEAGQGCSFIVNGGVDNLWLKDASSRIHVFADTCGPKTAWPFLQVTCEGPGCDRYISIQPCVDINDCTRGDDPEDSESQSCRPFFPDDASLSALLQEFNFSDGALPCSNPLARGIVIAITEGSIPDAGASVCGDTFEDWARRLYDLFAGGLEAIFGEDGDNGECNEPYGCEGDEGGRGDRFLEAVFGFLPPPPFLGTEINSEFDIAELPLPPGVSFDAAACAMAGCHVSNVGDGVCTPACNVPECAFDGNECAGCSCLQGQDYSACPLILGGPSMWGGEFSIGAGVDFSQGPDPVPIVFSDGSSPDRPLLFKTGNPRLRNVCQEDPSSPPPVPPQVWTPESPDCLTEPGSSTAAWFCTFGAFSDPLGLETLLLPLSEFEHEYNCSNGADSFFPRARKCFCALPANDTSCGLYGTGGPTGLVSSPLYSFGGMVQPSVLCGEPPSVPDVCPALVTRAAVPAPGLVEPGQTDGAQIDRDGLSLPWPDAEPAQDSIFFFDCDGTLSVSLYNEQLRLAASFPGALDFFDLLDGLLDILDTCSSSVPLTDPQERASAFHFWKAAFWHDVLIRDDVVGDVSGRADWKNAAREAFDTLFTLPNVTQIVPDASGFFDVTGTVADLKLRFAGLSELFEGPVELKWRTAECIHPISKASSYAFAITSPLLRDLFTNPQTCSDPVANDCGSPQLECVDFTEAFAQLAFTEDGDEEFAEVPGDEGIGAFRASLLDFLFYGGLRTSPGTCGAGDQEERGALRLARRVLLGLLGGRGLDGPGVDGDGVPAEEMLSVCVPLGIGRTLSAGSGPDIECSLLGGPSDPFFCDEGSVAACEAFYAFTPVASCLYGGSPDYFRFPFGSPFTDNSDPRDQQTCPLGPGAPTIAAERRCDRAICVAAEIGVFDGFSVVPTPPWFSGQKFDATGGVLVDFFSMGQCQAECSEGFLGPAETFTGSTPGQSFYKCVQVAQCTDGTTDHTCAESSALLGFLNGPYTRPVPSTNCDEIYPFVSSGGAGCCPTPSCTTVVDPGCGPSSCTPHAGEHLDVVNSGLPGFCLAPGYTACDNFNSVERSLNGGPFEPWPQGFTGLPVTPEACEQDVVCQLNQPCTCRWTLPGQNASESLCTDVLLNASCVEVGAASEGFLWRERQFPELTPGDDVNDFAAPNILDEFGVVPASLYTVPPPRLVNASFDVSQGHFVVTFDRDTTETLGANGGVFGPCDGVLEVEQAAGEALFCTWLDPLTLRFDANAASKISIGDTLRLLPGNGIRSLPLQLGDFSREAAGTAAITLFGVAPTPVIDVLGSGVRSACLDDVDFLGVAISGTAGRALTWRASFFDATLGIPLGLIDEVPEQSSPSILVPQAALGVLPPSYLLRVNATNWLGETSAFVTVAFSVPLGDIPEVTIDGPRTLSLSLGSDEPDLSATTRFLCEGFGFGEFLYEWELRALPLGLFEPIRGVPQGLPEASIRVPFDAFPAAGSYEVRVRAALDSDPAAVGTDVITVTVTAAPLVVLPAGGLQRVLFRTQPLRIDFTRSCDPAVGGPGICNPVFGATPGLPIAALFQPPPQESDIIWNCAYSATAVGARGACPAAFTSAIPPLELAFDIAAGQLPAGFYELTLMLFSQTSPTINIEVRPAPPASCTVVPTVLMQPVDPLLTVDTNGVLLFADVAGFAPGGAGPVRLLWQRVVGGVPRNDTSFADVRNRRALLLKPQALVPGNAYTFRLSAVQPCTAPDHPYGEVSFVVNRPPSSGIVTTSAAVGVAYETVFTLTATGFEDPEGDTALEYAFEYTMQQPSGVLQPSDVFALSRFTASPTLRTSLELPVGAQVPASNASIWVTAVARDRLGAVSARTGFTRIVLVNPINSAAWTPPPVVEELRAATATGGQQSDVLRAALGLASLANSAGATGAANLLEWAAGTRRTTLELLRNSSAAAKASNRSRTDTSLIALEASVLQTVLGDPSAVDPQLQAEALSIVEELLNRANATVAARRRSENDPRALGILPPQLNTDVLESLNALLAAARSSAEASRRLQTVSRRRSLQEAQAACSTAQGARAAVRELARLLAGTTDAGAGALASQSSQIQLSVARENPAALGSGRDGGDGLSALSLPPPLTGRSKNVAPTPSPSTGAPSFVAPPPRGSFELPPGVLGAFDGLPDIVDVVAASFAFNVRCEEQQGPLALTAAPTSQPIDNDCDGLEDEDFTYAGPLSEIEDVVTIEFISSAADATRFDPTGLSDTIRITLPRSAAADTVPRDLCNLTNATEAACGFFDEALGDWSAEGCALAADQGDDARLVVCECNHASDYAVWSAFTEDVRATFNDPITAVTSLAILMLGVIFPTIFCIFLLGLWWAQRKDKLDADKIQKGALGMMFLQRMQMRAKQKQFFDNLKQMVAEDRKVNQLESYQALQEEKQRNGGALLAAKKLNPFGRGLCWNFVLAIRYEHSLLGLVRFDPHYSRAQRVAVFTAILLGNLLAASLFFELKTTTDVSAGFLVSTVLLTSLFVSVPVRILIKTLFRASANRAGSRYDRVSNIFRVTSKLSDVTPSGPGGETDFALLLAYKKLFGAKREAALLRARIAMHKKARKSADRSAGRGVSGRFASRKMKEGLKVDPKHMSVFAFGAGGSPLDPDQAVVAPPAGGDGRVTALSASEGSEGSSDDSLESLEAQLNVALEAVAAAKKNLLDRTRAAQESWRDVPTAEAIVRVNRIRQQKSVLLRMSALLSDEALPVGKPRRPIFSSVMTYVAWAMLFAFYVLSVFYTTRFVLSRADRVGAGDPENEILLLWLFTAAVGIALGYLVAEPVVFFVRFALLPYLLLRFGKNSPAETEDTDLAEAELEEGLRKSRKSGKDGFDADKYRYEQNKALKAGKEKEKESSRDQYFFEIASDFIEAGF